eukprot:6202158-Pleurochrysis_carterae.AAC.3
MTDILPKWADGRCHADDCSLSNKQVAPTTRDIGPGDQRSLSEEQSRQHIALRHLPTSTETH